MAHTEDRYERFYLTVDYDTSVRILCNECGEVVSYSGGGSMRDIVASMDHHLETCTPQPVGCPTHGGECG